MSTDTLVLYDTTGNWGWLGELYGIMAANLASHFGAWTALPQLGHAASSTTGCGAPLGRLLDTSSS